MAINSPLVSVVMTTYNHEKYIAEAINSVLNQTLTNFELVIVNDGSNDRTDEIIKSFLHDRRIVYIDQENQGTSIATNNAILTAKGKYIALFSGDDICHHQRLEKQYSFICNSDFNYKIVFSGFDIIDDNGKLVINNLLNNWFIQQNKSPTEIINLFFFKGNCLNAITAFIERQLILDMGLFHITSIQTQDFEMWIKLIKHHEFFIISEKLMRYRIRDDNKNLSSSDNQIRTNFEIYELYKIIFDNMPIKLFKEAFQQHLKKPHFQEGIEYELEKAFLYLSHSSLLVKTIGCEKLFKLLQDQTILSISKAEYNFSLPELYVLTKNTDIFNTSLLQQAQEQLQQAQEQLQQTQEQLQQTQEQLQQTQNTLCSIESSKFWKLRQKWFKFRRLIGITNNEVSISLKGLLKKLLNLLPKFTTIVHQKNWYKDRPLVSVIIPCFNYGQYIDEAIDSVLSQTFHNFEIIVVDGGSTDNSTISILKSLQKPKTTIYYREGRHLVGDNRNFGIEKAEGKYICCLDADDKIKPTYLEKALFLLEVYAYDIVSTSVQCFGNSIETWNVLPNPTLENIVKANQVSTVAVFSKQMWKKANGYHDYGIGKDYISEDWDLWLRMIAIGARVINISEPLMLYRVHGKHTSLSNHPESMNLKDQAKTLASFNQEYLTHQAYKRSWNNNRTSYQVIDGNINLTNSYLEQIKEKTKLKILFALPFVITGGADTILLQIAKYLNENGFDISVITTIKTDTKFGDNTIRYEKITQEIYHLYKFLESQEKWKDYIYYYLESRQIDIIFIVGSVYFYEILPDIKKDFPNIKIVDQLFNEYGHIINNRKYAELIDMNILASQVIQEILLQKYQESEKKTRVIVHGVDTKREFNPINIDQQLILDIIPEGKFIVSYMGRFSEEKCPDKFIDLVHTLRDNKDVYFLMLGNGPEYDSVKLKIAELGLHDKIYAPGFVNDNKPFLKITDLLIIISRIEGIPIILMEGLSLGVPVIASRIGGIPGIVTDGYNGFLCDPNNTHEFANQIIKVYSDKNLQSKLKVNARTYAEEKLDISKMNDEYIKIFLSLINDNKL